MTVEEYIDLLLSAGIIKDAPDTASADMVYFFTDKGFRLIREKFPEYPSNWPAAIWKNPTTDGLEFWGVPDIDNDMFRWTWFNVSRQDVMENTLKNVFNIDPDDSDYIELDDIVL